MLPNFSKLSLRCAPCGTVHARPPAPAICPICQDPLWGAEDDDEDDEGGDATKRVGRVDMPPDLEAEVRRRLGNRKFNRLVEPNRLLAPPDKWRMRHEEGNPAQRVPVISLSCDHWFHVSCIANWASQKPNRPQCPTCKSAAQPGQRIIDQDLRDMGMADLIPPPPAAPAPAAPPTVAEARGALDEARQRQRSEAQRQRSEAQRQRNLRDEAAAAQREERERALRETNRRKSIARLRTVLARRAIKHFEDKSRDFRRYVGWEQRQERLTRDVVTRENVLQTARRKLSTDETRRSRSEQKQLEDNVAEQEAKLARTRDQLSQVESSLRVYTRPVVTYVDAALRNRGQAYLALADAMRREVPPEETARAASSARQWLQLLLEQDPGVGPTHMSADFYEKGTFFNRVVDQMARPLRMVEQDQFALAVVELISVGRAEERWLGGGDYAHYEERVVAAAPGEVPGQLRRSRPHIVGSLFGLVSRGLWLIDPLVPMPGMETPSGGRQVQWPPQPEGDVPIPNGVSLWLWSRGRERWEPEGLVTPAPQPTAEERAYINALQGGAAWQTASESVRATMVADARAAMALLDQPDPEPFDHARDGFGGYSRRAMARRARQLVLNATRHSDQIAVNQMITQILLERGEAGVPRTNPNHMALFVFKDDLTRIIRMYPDYPPGDELTEMRERAEAFLAAVDVMHLWTQLGIRGDGDSEPTEETITSQVTAWFIEEVE